MKKILPITALFLLSACAGAPSLDTDPYVAKLMARCMTKLPANKQVNDVIRTCGTKAGTQVIVAENTYNKGQSDIDLKACQASSKDRKEIDECYLAKQKQFYDARLGIK